MKEQFHSITQETAGKIAVAIGSGGTVLDYATELEGWIKIFTTYGNAVLLLCGLYLMYHKIFDKRRDRRGEDE